MSEAVIIALISAGIPTITTAIVGFVQSRTAQRNSAKSDILQMIMEDHLAVHEGHIPTNYQNIMAAYDRYHQAGGDSYITDKKDEYKQWFIDQERKKLK